MLIVTDEGVDRTRGYAVSQQIISTQVQWQPFRLRSASDDTSPCRRRHGRRCRPRRSRLMDTEHRHSYWLLFSFPKLRRAFRRDRARSHSHSPLDRPTSSVSCVDRPSPFPRCTAHRVRRCPRQTREMNGKKKRRESRRDDCTGRDGLNGFGQ